MSVQGVRTERRASLPLVTESSAEATSIECQRAGVTEDWKRRNLLTVSTTFFDQRSEKSIPYWSWQPRKSHHWLPGAHRPGQTLRRYLSAAVADVA